MSLLQIGSIEMLLNRKPIKNLHISVLPPDGKVRVSAPEHMSDTAIRMAVVSRIPWIRKQQAAFANQPRQSLRELVSGECHYLWGKRYRLDVVEQAGRHAVQVMGGNRIRLTVSPATTVANRTRALDEFYRGEIKQRITDLLKKWQSKTEGGLSSWGVKKMKTKWGSCNPHLGRIWLNLELAKKPPECLEYILVHELVHLVERHHNERFKSYMDTLMPDWRERRSLLNSSPLAHTEWRY